MLLIFGECIQLRSHHQNPVLEHFHDRKKFPHVRLQLISQPQEIADVLTISIKLPFLDISCKRRHTDIVFCIWLPPFSLCF